MQTYSCPRCGDQVTQGDNHPCDPMVGVKEKSPRADAVNRAQMTVEQVELIRRVWRDYPSVVGVCDYTLAALRSATQNAAPPELPAVTSASRPDDQIVSTSKEERQRSAKGVRDSAKYPAVAAPSAAQEPVAYMFRIRYTGKGKASEFAAIDHHLQDGEELLSKMPLYAAPPSAEQEWNGFRYETLPPSAEPQDLRLKEDVAWDRVRLRAESIKEGMERAAKICYESPVEYGGTLGDRIRAAADMPAPSEPQDTATKALVIERDALVLQVAQLLDERRLYVNCLEGWKLVPIKATDEMEERGMEKSVLGRPSVDDEKYVLSIYDAMLAAAPSHPIQEDR